MSQETPDAETQASALRPLRPEPLIAALVDHRVDFIVVGGYAVAAHGFPRATKDIDICPDPSDDNLGRLAKALATLEATPIGLDEFEGEFDLEPDLEGLRLGGNWTLLTKHGRLDVMQTFGLEGSAEGQGGYRDLASHSVDRMFLGHQVEFCSYDDLLRMKQAAGRAQDKVDVESLRTARGEL
ncbi:MAG TPA: hypothetical protein VK471_03005 [Solirubrobacterales bacterium]|nr:hypothetical protein [Solirubrobacterales bacterium]